MPRSHARRVAVRRPESLRSAKRGRIRTILSLCSTAASLQPTQVNGYPALIIRLNGEIDTVIAVRVNDGLITGLYAVRNPEKLSHMEQETTLRR